MTPEGCAPLLDLYTGVVTRVDRHRAVVRWDDPRAGGPPAACGIPRERPERREWWDTDGACVAPPVR
eukprot:gene24854-48386_t